MERKVSKGFTESEIAAALFSKKFKSQKPQTINEKDKFKSYISSSSRNDNHNHNRNERKDVDYIHRNQRNNGRSRSRSPPAVVDTFGRDLPRRESDRSRNEIRNYDRRSRSRDRYNDNRDEHTRDRDKRVRNRSRSRSRSRSPVLDSRRYEREDRNRRNNDNDDLDWIHDKHTVDEPGYLYVYICRYLFCHVLT